MIASPWGVQIVGYIDAVRVAVTNPLTRDAHGSVPDLVLLALKLSVRVTLPVVALLLLVLIGAVQAIIVTVAEVDPWDAVSVVAREEIAKAGLLLRLTVTWRLVAAVVTVLNEKITQLRFFYHDTSTLSHLFSTLTHFPF